MGWEKKQFSVTLLCQWKVVLLKIFSALIPLEYQSRQRKQITDKLDADRSSINKVQLKVQPPWIKVAEPLGCSKVSFNYTTMDFFSISNLSKKTSSCLPKSSHVGSRGALSEHFASRWSNRTAEWRAWAKRCSSTKCWGTPKRRRTPKHRSTAKATCRKEIG